jgi:hypothetical protein
MVEVVSWRRTIILSPSNQLQAEADVYGSGGVGDGAYGYEIGSGFGVGLDGIEGDASGEFYLRPFVDFIDPFACFDWSQIIQE